MQSSSNSHKLQQKAQQQHQEPPRYQPPPQPSSSSSSSSSLVKNNSAVVVVVGGGLVGAAGATTTSTPLLTAKQLHQMHQQQAAKLASQVKDAVQTKFQPHKLDRADKLQGGFGLHQPKSYLPSGIPTPTATTPTALAATTNSQQQQQQQQQLGGGGGGGGGGGLPIANVPLNGLQQPAAASRQRISDDEFLRLGPVEMLKFVRKTESDIARLVAEQHRQIQALVNELRALKEANQRLSDDNQELRDLCCFLDDDRQKGRKLAREWQRFGRYTASVMRQEVSAYQNKLRQLDNKQQELIKDNLELKELCLYLDEERGGGQRDDGDGSSSSTNADESAPAPTRIPRHAASTFNDQMMQYVRSLEQRIKQLEEDKSVLQARAQQNWTANEPWDNNQRNVDDCHLGSRPEAVVRALQVLEVREQLEREAGHDGEKALVREMCNVVWRKLEEGPAQNRH